MLCPDFLGPNTCTLHYLEVVGVGVVMEHAPIDQEVCQEGGAEVLKVAGGRGTISNYDKVQCFIGQSGLPSHVLRGLDLRPTAKIKLQPPSMRSKARDIQRLECSMRLSSKCITLLYRSNLELYGSTSKKKLGFFNF